MSAYCREVFGEVWLVWGRIRLGRITVGICPAWSGLCRDVFGEVGLMLERERRSRFCVGTCSAMSA